MRENQRAVDPVAAVRREAQYRVVGNGREPRRQVGRNVSRTVGGNGGRRGFDCTRWRCADGHDSCEGQRKHGSECDTPTTPHLFGIGAGAVRA